MIKVVYLKHVDVSRPLPLTPNKVYDVLKSKNFLYGIQHLLIENDNNKRVYSSKIFISLDEYRELQLNTLLNSD